MDEREGDAVGGSEGLGIGESIVADAFPTSELGMRAWKILNGSEEVLEAVEGDDARRIFFPTSARSKRNNPPSRPST